MGDLEMGNYAVSFALHVLVVCVKWHLILRCVQNEDANLPKKL